MTEEIKKEDKPQMWEAQMTPKHPPRRYRVTDGLFEVVYGTGIFLGPIKHEFTKGSQVLLDGNETKYYVQDVQDESFRLSKDSEGKKPCDILNGHGMIVQATGKIVARKQMCLDWISKQRMEQFPVLFPLRLWTPIQNPPEAKSGTFKEGIFTIKDHGFTVDDDIVITTHDGILHEMVVRLTEGDTFRTEDWSGLIDEEDIKAAKKHKPKKTTHWKMGIPIEEGQKPYYDSDPGMPMFHPFQQIWRSDPPSLRKKPEDPPKEEKKEE